MSGHTKGPWAVNFTKFSEVRAENGAVIARCLKLTSLTNLEANALRIVACVNACEGVSTKHLENNLPIRELDTRYNEVLREIEALKAGQAELLEALGYCEGWFATHSPTAKLINGHFAEHPMLTCIRAAIAKANEGGK